MRFLFLYLFIWLIAGCSKEKRDDCFTALGDSITITRRLSPEFNKLYLSDRVELTLVQDSVKAGTIDITAPEGLIEQITAEINSGLLKIDNNNTCNFVRSYDYTISAVLYVNELVEITTESISSITTQDTLYINQLVFYNLSLANSSLILKGNSILVESFNSASTELSGVVATLRGSIEEVSELDASGLDADEIILDTHTPFDTYVNPLRGIYVKIYNSGDVVYLTEPSEYKIAAERTGTGELRKK